MDIKKKADEYKNQTGNDGITQKDLLFYIVSRLDDLEKKLQESEKKQSSLSTQVKVFWILLPIAVSLAAYISNILG